MTTPTTPLDPLVSDTQVDKRMEIYRSWLRDERDADFRVASHHARGYQHGALEVRDIYEADRVKREEVMREAILKMDALKDCFEVLRTGYRPNGGSLDWSNMERQVHDVSILLSSLNERTNTP